MRESGTFKSARHVLISSVVNRCAAYPRLRSSSNDSTLYLVGVGRTKEGACGGGREGVKE